LTALPTFRRSGINVIATWGHRLGGVIFSLCTIPIITRHFGMEGMGIWLLVLQYSNHLQLLELGLNTSIGRFISRYLALQDAMSVSSYLSAAFVTLAVLGLGILILSPILGIAFTAVFASPGVEDGEISLLVILASAAVALSLPLRTGIGLLSSVHRFDRIALWESVSLALRLILILALFTYSHPSLVTLGLIYFVPTLLVNICMFWDGYRIVKRPAIGIAGVSRSHLAALFSVSLSAMVITFSAVALRQGSPMLVGYQLGAQSVALLAFPLLILAGLTPFINIANQLISPLASQADALSQKERLYKAYITAVRYSLSAALMALILIYLLGEEALGIWLQGSDITADDIQVMALALLIIFGSFCLCVPALVGRSILVSVGGHWRATRGELFSVVLGLAIGTLLMSETGFGVIGMSIGIAASFLIRGLGTLFRYTTQYFEVPYWKLLKEAVVAPALTGILAAASIPPILRWAHLGFWQDFAAALAASVIWCAGAWIFVVPPDHKERLVIKAKELFGVKRFWKS
jgi:O-antigen/teichoic acid export membrane protein